MIYRTNVELCGNVFRGLQLQWQVCKLSANRLVFVLFLIKIIFGHHITSDIDKG